MTEDIIHFAWKYNPTLVSGLALGNQGEIELISAGEHNFDSGPDFFNAKVRIGETIWAGNVEIHINASDWTKHGHQNNPAFDSVILHVVAKNDAIVYNSKGDIVPTVEIPYPNNLEWELQSRVATDAWIPCANQLKTFNSFTMRMWLSSLAVERLEQKTLLVNDLVKQYNGSWEEAFYVSIARSFGLKINALPFEMLAKSTPLKVLAKVKDSILSVEALLFGQAGMLNFKENHADSYMLNLKKEYEYQRGKFQLNPIPEHLWKFMRLRPGSFPTIRIAQFAKLVHQSSGLFSRCTEATSFDTIINLLKVECSSYWQSHYTFGNESKSKEKILGNDMIKVLALNTIVPFMFAYGFSRGNDELRDRALNFLESIAPEKNNVVKGFASSGVNADNAFFSQAMVQLKSQYCDKRKCLYCQVGANVLLKKKV
jgi:hypothetical protein